MPNLFRHLMNAETYILILRIFLGAGLTAMSFAVAVLADYVGSMHALIDPLLWTGSGVFIIGLIGIVHWNMTE